MSHPQAVSIFHQPLNEDGVDPNTGTKPDEARPLPGDVAPGD